MIWGKTLTAMCAVGCAMFTSLACAEDIQPFPVMAKSRDVLSIETSLRSRFNWSEIVLRGNKPRAWDLVTSPEARITLRLLSDILESKIELGLVSDWFDHFQSNNSYTVKGEVQLGARIGNWSILAEWKGRDSFNYETGDFQVGLNVYDVRVRYRFNLQLFDRLPFAQISSSSAFGYSAAVPSAFQRYFAEGEVEALQALGNGFSVTIAPKIEFNDYPNFVGLDRDDTVFSVRVVPAYTFDNGLSVSVEGQATTSYSTMDTKTGESWGITPILRLQRRL